MKTFLRSKSKVERISPGNLV